MMGNGFVSVKHPEIKEKEFLFCNVKRGNEWTITGNKHRFGKTAYDSMGYPINGHIPVFAQKEIDNK